MDLRKLITIMALAAFIGVLNLQFRTVLVTRPYTFPELGHFPEMPHAENNPVTEEGVKLGRCLFYDPILSADSSISCSSCHKQKYAFSDRGHKFSKGLGGEQQRRNTPPLFNLAWSPAFFWDGKASTIEEQVFHPVRAHEEMGLNWMLAEKRISGSSFYKPLFRKAFGEKKIDSTLIAKAIAQFERTLISHNSKYDKVLRRTAYFTKDEYEGFVLINDQTKGDCLHCHTTDADPLGTTGKFSNNGLDPFSDPSDFIDKGKAEITGKQEDIGLFKIPSLRNIALTAPYMHDGRFNTLEEVIDFYSEGVNPCFNVDSKMEFAHKGGAHLSEDEKSQIIAFLYTLTDSVFIVNSRYNNPFK